LAGPTESEEVCGGAGAWACVGAAGLSEPNRLNPKAALDHTVTIAAMATPERKELIESPFSGLSRSWGLRGQQTLKHIKGNSRIAL
jgi:hypothetical protein